MIDTSLQGMAVSLLAQDEQANRCKPCLRTGV